MTYVINYELFCNWPDGCDTTWSERITTGVIPGEAARLAGWEVAEDNEDWDLCPPHAGASVLQVPAPDTGPDLPPVPQALTVALVKAPKRGIWSGRWLARNVRPRARVHGQHAAPR